MNDAVCVCVCDGVVKAEFWPATVLPGWTPQVKGYGTPCQLLPTTGHDDTHEHTENNMYSHRVHVFLILILPT